MDIKHLIEELNNLMEDDIPEDVLQDEIEPEVTPEVKEVEKPDFNDSMSLADEFDAKAKIARALETLEAAVVEFKDATAEKVDLIKDNLLLQEIEGLDLSVEGIKSALISSNLVPETPLNDPFKAEEPAENIEVEEPEVKEEPVESEEEPEKEAEEEEIASEADFDLQAGLNLLGNKTEE